MLKLYTKYIQSTYFTPHSTHISLTICTNITSTINFTLWRYFLLKHASSNYYSIHKPPWTSKFFHLKLFSFTIYKKFQPQLWICFAQKYQNVGSPYIFPHYVILIWILYKPNCDIIFIVYSICPLTINKTLRYTMSILYVYRDKKSSHAEKV